MYTMNRRAGGGVSHALCCWLVTKAKLGPLGLNLAVTELGHLARDANVRALLDETLGEDDIDLMFELVSTD